MNMRRNMTPEIGHVWILGGTGAVGQQVARLLPRHRVGEVITVSRRAKVKKARAEWPRHMQVDLDQAEVSLPFHSGDRVINLTERTPPSLVAEVVRRGAVFIDCSASPAYVSALRRAAREASGPGYLVDNTGVAPGLTNMMAHRLADRHPETRRMEIAVELGLGNHAGLAATEWFLRNLGTTYDVMFEGERRVLRPGQLRDHFAFHAGSPDRIALCFPFVEQSVLAEELSGPCATILSYLALDPPWATAAVGGLLRWGAGGFLSRNAGRAARVLLRLPKFGSATTRIIVRGFDGEGWKSGELRFVTGDQTNATAAITAATALAAPSPLVVSGPGFTAADILTLDEAVAIIRAVQPDALLEDDTRAGPDLQKRKQKVAG